MPQRLDQLELREAVVGNFNPKDTPTHSIQAWLSAGQKQKFKNQKNNKLGLFKVLSYLMLLLISGLLLIRLGLKYHSSNDEFHLNYNNLYITLPLLILQSYFISFMFHGLHELTHRTVFKEIMLNDIFSHIFGILCLRPANHYYYYHWAHHKYTGNKLKDPELQNTLIDLDINGSVLYYILYLSGIPFWLDRILTMLRHSILAIFIFIGFRKYMTSKLLYTHEYYLRSVRNNRNDILKKVCYEALVYFIFYTIILSGFCYSHHALEVKYGWFIPSIIGQVFLRCYLLNEHGNCKVSNNMIDNTRSTKTWWIVRFLAWNMNYHLEHHAYPWVPYHKLPELHKALAESQVKRLKNSGHKKISSNKNDSESIFYNSLGCNPNGYSGYLSLHKVYLFKQYRNEIFTITIVTTISSIYLFWNVLMSNIHSFYYKTINILSF